MTKIRNHQNCKISVYKYPLYRDGPTMLAILAMMGTRHACNIDDKRDKICLPCNYGGYHIIKQKNVSQTLTLIARNIICQSNKCHVFVFLITRLGAAIICKSLPNTKYVIVLVHGKNTIFNEITISYYGVPTRTN